MSQYLSAFALLLLVMSPVLIPAIIALVHRTIAGVRAVATGARRRGRSCSRCGVDRRMSLAI